MTRTSTPQELATAQANAYRDARKFMSGALRAIDADSLADQVYRETMRIEMDRMADLEDELRRDAR